MEFTRLLQFLNLIIVNIRTELLVLIGDPQKLSALVDIHRNLEMVLPSTILCAQENGRVIETRLCLMDCPKKRLTLIWINDRYIRWAFNLIYPNNFATNRIVLLWDGKIDFKDLEQLVYLFGTYNVVIVEFSDYGYFQVLAWGLSLPYGNKPSSIITRFNGPEAIFRSKDQNAIAFRQNLQQWPSRGDPVKALFITTLLPPYNFILRIEESNRLLIASSKLILLTMISNVLDLSLRVQFLDDKSCPLCFAPHSMRRNFQRIPLTNHNSMVNNENW